MRITGAALLFFGLILGIVGFFSGCNMLFGWNGRHAVSAQPLAADGPTVMTFDPEAGVRYSVSIQVVFDREAVERKNAAAHVEARMPLVASVKDGVGNTLAQVSGWFDPNEPPNVLYGSGAKESARMPELTVERLIGPFISASVAPLKVSVELGADTIGTAEVTERRLAIYDDKTPPPMRNAFIGGSFGALLFLAGMLISLVGFFRRKKKKRLLRT